MGGERALLSVPQLTPASPVVVIFALTAQLEARFRDALRGRATIILVRSFDEIAFVIRETTRPVDIVVLPGHDNAAEATRTVRLVAAERPDCAIVAYCRVGSQFSSDIRALATAGVHQFIFLGVDDAGIAFRDVLEKARRQCAAMMVMKVL